MTQPGSTALLLIDVQQGLDDPRWGARNNPEAEQRIADLLAHWRATGRPVIHASRRICAAMASTDSSSSGSPPTTACRARREWRTILVSPSPWSMMPPRHSSAPGRMERTSAPISCIASRWPACTVNSRRSGAPRTFSPPRVQTLVTTRTAEYAMKQPVAVAFAPTRRPPARRHSAPPDPPSRSPG